MSKFGEKKMKWFYSLIAVILFTTFTYGQNIVTWNVDIDSAASVTDTLDLYDGGFDTRLKLIAIQVDTPWTDADLTFLAGNQAGSAAVLGELVEMDGTAITCDVDSTFNNYFALKPTLFAGVRFFQIRSGTAGTPVAQDSTRTLKIYLREY